MKTIYLVRHGSTPLNESGTFQVHDTPLSEKGRQQARILGERFKSINFDAIISSEMARAAETAQAIADATGHTVIPSPLFYEKLQPSAIRGKHRKDPEVNAIYESILDSFSDASRRHSDEENFFDLKSRALKALRFLEEYPAEHLVVVTHGTFLKMLVTVMAKGDALTPEFFNDFEWFLYPSNTGITKCLFKEGKWLLETWNDNAHLGELPFH